MDQRPLDQMTHPTPVKIKQARLDAGLTLQAAADLIGIGLKQWQHYESGYSKPTHRRWALFLRLVSLRVTPTK